MHRCRTVGELSLIGIIVTSRSHACLNSLMSGLINIRSHGFVEHFIRAGKVGGWIVLAIGPCLKIDFSWR